VPGEGEDGWQENVSYQIGDIVEHNGSEYKCIQDHTSQADYSPKDSVSLWRLLSSGEEYPQWEQPDGAHDAYKIGDKVEHEGYIWECTQGDAEGLNVYEPGVWGWTQIEPFE
jgi:chitodextrinase